MNKRKFYMKQYICIVLVVLVFFCSQNVYGQGTGETSFPAYDLLFVATPISDNWQHWGGIDFSNEARSLYYYDSVTQEITRLAVMDNLFGPQAISPDEQYLAVLRDEQMCLVNGAWETFYCVDFPVVSSRPPRLAGYNYPPHNIYWDDDGATFWLQYVDVPDNADGSLAERSDIESELRHIDTATGGLLEAIDLIDLWIT
jgi:hypothetical protein